MVLLPPTFHQIINLQTTNKMTKIILTKEELRQLKAAKKQLLTDTKTYWENNPKSQAIVKKVADKYNVDTQIIYNLIP